MAGALTKAGRYHLVSELGRGSMGVVYQGFDPVIGRTVAIKTMLPKGLAPAEFEEYKARFQREAQAAGVLTHPNIVTVYDFGEDNGVLYLAMEFLEGKSLQQLHEEQNILPVETVIPMYEQVCSALDHAHAHKIVHRDIKPANIMILESGLVKVTDFGIAKLMSMGMTQAGQILGTPNYMSPEQVRGRPVDGRADIFSLGVILYELVTGEKPFGGQNITTVIYKIINENPIPPRDLDATIHPGLSYVIGKALAKSPDERYQTCRELANDLKNYRDLGGAPASLETVIIRVPPVQGAPLESVSLPPPAQEAPAAPPAAEERKPVRPLSVHVIPPARPQPQGSSAAAWVLLALLVAGGLGGGYYFYRSKPQATEDIPPASSATTAQEPVVPSTRAETSPPSVTPSATTNAASSDTAPKVEPRPDQGQPPETRVVASKPERTTPRVPTAAAAGTARPPATPKLGQLVVTANVEGAQVTIDGQSQPDWLTPLTFPELAAGTHLVLVTKEGYSPAQRTVTVVGGGTSTLSVGLNIPSGEINIVTNPPGMEVWIDGKSYGPSPVGATVSAGQHTYAIKRPGAEPYEGSFTMRDGAIMTRRVDLAAGMSAPTGIVEVRTIPPGATVYADGSPLGQTPTSLRLPAGRHMLTISLSGFRPLRREIDVPAHGSIPVNETLSRQ